MNEKYFKWEELSKDIQDFLLTKMERILGEYEVEYNGKSYCLVNLPSDESISSYYIMEYQN